MVPFSHTSYDYQPGALASWANNLHADSEHCSIYSFVDQTLQVLHVKKIAQNFLLRSQLDYNIKSNHHSNLTSRRCLGPRKGGFLAALQRWLLQRATEIDRCRSRLRPSRSRPSAWAVSWSPVQPGVVEGWTQWRSSWLRMHSLEIQLIKNDRMVNELVNDLFNDLIHLKWLTNT